MARIRTIKPEFFRSPSTAKASFGARILFQAMWCWADDYGIGETNLNGLLGFAFPDDDEIERAELQSILKEVQRAYEVVFYKCRGRYFYAIPSWDSHQKTERRAQVKRNPPPDDPDSLPDLRFHGSDGTSERTQGNSARPQGKTPAGTGEQGNRGTGEEQTCATKLREPNPASASFAKFWAAYPRRRDRRKAERAFTAALKRADADTIIEGAHRYAADPNREDQFTKYAEGWLNGDGWLDEPLPNRISHINGNHVHVATSDLRVAQVQALKNRPEHRLEIE